MNEFLKVLIPALLGLLGTIGGALLVHRRWKAERAVGERAQYRSERRDVYKKLWELLETVHLASRRANLTDEEFSSALLDLNSFMLKNDVYLESDLHPLANTYAKTVRSFHSKVRQSGDQTAILASSDSVTIPSETIRLAIEIEAVGKEADRIRSDLKQRVENVLKT